MKNGSFKRKNISKMVDDWKTNAEKWDNLCREKQTVKGWLFAEKRGKKWAKTVRVDFVFETFFALCIAHIIILFIFELTLLDLYPFFTLYLTDNNEAKQVKRA